MPCGVDSPLRSKGGPLGALRILIADNHELVRLGVRAILRRHLDWEICGEAQNGREAVAKARLLRPDVVVIETSMPELNGVDAACQMLKLRPSTRVLFLTKQYSEELLGEILNIGALGYLLKSDPEYKLLRAIEAVGNGDPYLTAPAHTSTGQGTPTRSASQVPRRALTPREREVLQLLAEGRRTRDIASMLSLSGKTVDVHRCSVRRKLGLHSLAELTRYAIRNNIVAA